MQRISCLLIYYFNNNKKKIYYYLIKLAILLCHNKNISIKYIT